jgi:hypothetical protein
MDVLDKTQTCLAVHLGLVYIYMTTGLDRMAMAWRRARLHEAERYGQMIKRVFVYNTDLLVAWSFHPPQQPV